VAHSSTPCPPNSQESGRALGGVPRQAGVTDLSQYGGTGALEYDICVDPTGLTAAVAYGSIVTL
jgi:hypothetical protein